MTIGAAANAQEKRLEIKPQSTTRVGGLVIQSYLVKDIPRNGRLIIVTPGNFVQNSLRASLASFDVKYTSEGGYKVLGARANVTVADQSPNDGKATLRCVCEIYDDNSGHNSTGMMVIMVIAQSA